MGVYSISDAKDERVIQVGAYSRGGLCWKSWSIHIKYVFPSCSGIEK